MAITKNNSRMLNPVVSTGSTEPRTLEDRFADVVNVKDFGAVGDGGANDQPAIQAAIDYAWGLADDSSDNKVRKGNIIIDLATRIQSLQDIATLPTPTTQSNK